jgi:Tol biopolymer transport system component
MPVEGITGGLAVSPDGSQLAFAYTTLEAGLQIAITGLSSFAPRLLTTTRFADKSEPSWSPDGKTIIYSHSADSNSGLWVVPADGSAPERPLTDPPFYAVDPVWSPDGSRLTFAARLSDFTDMETFVADADGSRPVRLTFGGGEDVMPSWSPDGTQLAFLSDIAASDQDDPTPEIYVMSADGSTPPVRLTNNSDFETAPAWRP